MSWGVALRNAVGLGLGGIPSLLNAAPYPLVNFNFLSGQLDPRITFSRTSNATLIGSDGTLQYAPHNLLTYSEQFDNAAWTKAQSTITSNSVVAPDGTTTADKLVEDATNSQHVLFRSTSIVANTPFAASGYFKAGERTRINFRLLNGTFNSGANVTFDLSAGTTPFSSLVGTATNLLFSITPVGNGWYRCAVSCVVDTTSTTGVWAAYLVNTGNNDTYLGDGTSGIYTWGAQLNVGALQPYYSTTVKNLLGYSQEFNDVFWNKSNSTITANVTAAPDSSVTADKLVEDTTNSTHVFFNGAAVTAIGPSTYSLYVKAAERNWVNIRHTGLSAFFNIATGQIGTVDAGLVASIVSVGNGWYRCAVVKAAGATGAIGARISTGDGMDFYTGDGTSGIFIWGTQFSDSASLDPYVYNPAAAPSNTAYYGPRFDYDPTTLAPLGLLIEEQRTNSIRNNTAQGAVAGTPGTLPTYWDITTGTINGITRTIVGTGVESGISYVDIKYSGTAVGAGNVSITSEYSNQVAAAQNQVWTFSCYARLAAGSFASTTSRILYVNSYTAAGGFDANSSSTGTNYPANGPSNASLISQRYFFTGTLASATTACVNAGFYFTYNAGAVIDFTLRIGLPQLELGAFATSVIPTTTTALTRAADVASVTGANFSSWYNSVEGTMLVDAQVINTTAVGISGVLASIGDSATFNETLYLSRGSASTNVTANVIDNGVAQWAANTLGAAAANTVFKVAMAYKLDNLGGSFNGATPVTDNVATIPTVNILTLGNGSWSGATNWVNGYIRSFKYYPTRLRDSALQALTR